MADQLANKESIASKLTQGRDYFFVNNIRFVSMAAIVLVHCATRNEALYGPSQTSPLCHLLAMIFKFGTINFFLVAGFLAGDRLHHHSPGEYLKRRVRSICVPWLLWSFIWCAFMVIYDRHAGTFASHAHNGPAQALLHYVYRGVFRSPFWFVPNLIFAFSLLFLVRRWMTPVVTGTVLAAFSLFYGVNVYSQWVPSLHLEACCGYIFYIWLGMWATQNFTAIERRLSAIPISALMMAAALLCLTGYVESRVLAGLGAPDDLNTMRISNQLYSIAIALLLLKLRRPLPPRFFRVRETTFGIYLTHYLVSWFVAAGLTAALTHIRISGYWGIQGWSLLTLVAMFAVTYGISLMIVFGLLSFPSLRWTVSSAASARKVRTPAPMPEPTSA